MSISFSAQLTDCCVITVGCSSMAHSVSEGFDRHDPIDNIHNVNLCPESNATFKSTDGNVQTPPVCVVDELVPVNCSKVMSSRCFQTLDAWKCIRL